MFDVVARLVSRGPIIGLVMPTGSKPLPYGIYEIREFMGEYTLRRVGVPAMTKTRMTAHNLEGLLSHRPESVMTRKELSEVVKSQNKGPKTRRKKGKSLPDIAVDNHKSIVKSDPPPEKDEYLEMIMDRVKDEQ